MRGQGQDRVLGGTHGHLGSGGVAGEVEGELGNGVSEISESGLCL
jgi:hypothetical protein